MAVLKIWLESPNNLPVPLIVEDNIPVFRLKSRLMARFNPPHNGPDGKLMAYEIVALRTGTILREDDTPISHLVEDGDRFVLRQASDMSTQEAVGQVLEQASSDSVGQTHPKNVDHKTYKSFTGAFSITGIEPFSLDFTAEYPVLAINVRYAYTVDAGVRSEGHRSGTDNILSSGKPIYAKDAFFLMADKEDKFKWVSPTESSYYTPALSKIFLEHDNRRLTRYSLEKDIGGCRNMIYPVRPFSITGVSMEGFDPGKEYPVLAIDIDKYINEIQTPEEDVIQDQQPSQMMAFFLVGDDNGEFAWIAEDECRLAG